MISMATKFPRTFQLVVLLTQLLAKASLTAQVANPPITPRISIVAQSQTTPASYLEMSPPAVADLGSTIILTAEVEGSGPLQFQWFMNGAIVEGATNAAHILRLVESADDGIYSVVVTNSAGRSTSDPTRLFVSNIKAARYMSLTANSPVDGGWQIQYADSLASNTLWRPLASATASAAPLVVVDSAATTSNQRFYRTAQTNTLVGRMLPGWSYIGPTGSVHAIEFIEPGSVMTDWRKLQIFTLRQSPLLFVDATATNGFNRRYRTTLLESPLTRRVGRLAFTIAWILPSEIYSKVSLNNRQELAALGISFNDQEHALQSPTNAAAGEWIALGDQRVMADSNGNFQIDVPAGVTNGFALRAASERSTQAEASFNVNQLALPGQTPVPILLRYVREGMPNMNSSLPPASISSAADKICGDVCSRIGNLSPCCLDYDGFVNDGCRYFTGAYERLIRYFGSTCWRFTSSLRCANELTSQSFIPFFRGPGCFVNHKYRNCQNIVENDLLIVASKVTVACGESIALHVRNNTWANETVLALRSATLKAPGRLAGQRLNLSMWAPFVLLHYDDNLKKHVEDSVIQYIAPTREEMGPGMVEEKIQISAFAAGEERMIEITVSCGNCETDPAVIPILNMVWIPPGTFSMGSPDSEPTRSSLEGPQVQMTISRGFCMGKYEVTQAEYESVMGLNPSGFFGHPDRPVEQVSWDDAMAYCATLTRLERNGGRLPTGWHYRLPTEAEWEYACRAGTTTAFHYGPALRSGMANFDGRYEFPPCGGEMYWCLNRAGTYPSRTTDVGSYAPNAWGLYDMHGNVWEWCSDWLTVFWTRAIRGGSWFNCGAYRCRSAMRDGWFPGYRGPDVGFRVVLAPSQP